MPQELNCKPPTIDSWLLELQEKYSVITATVTIKKIEADDVIQYFRYGSDRYGSDIFREKCG